jgi:hypothetical protein
MYCKHRAVPLGLATDVREAKTAAQAHRESTEEAGGGEGGDAEGQGPVEEEGTIVKMMTKPPTRSPAPTPHPAHILMPIKGLEKPHMECPDGTVVDETVAYWKVRHTLYTVHTPSITGMEAGNRLLGGSAHRTSPVSAMSEPPVLRRNGRTRRPCGSP